MSKKVEQEFDLSAYNHVFCWPHAHAMPTRLEHELHLQHVDMDAFAEDFFSWLERARFSRVRFLPQYDDVAFFGDDQLLFTISPALYANILSFFVRLTQGRLLHHPATFFHYQNNAWNVSVSGRVAHLRRNGDHDDVLSLHLHYMPVQTMRFSDIHANDPHVAMLTSYLRKPRVAVIVVGPDGSGKTTTVATMLRDILGREEIIAVSLDRHPELQIDGMVYTHDIKHALRRSFYDDVDLLHFPDVAFQTWYEQYMLAVGAFLRQGMRVIGSVATASLDTFAAALDALPRTHVEEFLTHGTVVFVTPNVISRRGQKTLTLKTLPLDAGLRTLFLSGASMTSLLHHARANGF